MQGWMAYMRVEFSNLTRVSVVSGLGACIGASPFVRCCPSSLQLALWKVVEVPVQGGAQRYLNSVQRKHGLSP